VVAPATEQFERDAAKRIYNAAQVELGVAGRVVAPLFVRGGVGLRTSPAQRIRVEGQDVGDNPSPSAFGSLGLVVHF
jgi:hypothetical protein